MARQCMRPGCDRLAAARLTYDSAAGAVWLDPPLEDGQPAQQVCSAHARTLTAPLGWTITDRRLIDVNGSGASMPPPIVEGEVSPFTEARRAARAAEPGAFIQQTLVPGSDVAQSIGPEAPVSDDLVSEDEVPEQSPAGAAPAGTDDSETTGIEHSEPEPAQPEPAEPEDPGSGRSDTEEPHQGDPAEEESPAKSGSKPRGKLLDRAFEWTGPQHSVLTTAPAGRPQQTSD